MKLLKRVRKKEIVRINIRLIKKTCVAFFLLISISSCDFEFSGYNDNPPPTSESLIVYRVELDLKGSVKSYHLIVHKAIEDSGNITEGEIIGNKKSFFNTDGNKIEFESYEVSGRLNHKTIYSYTINGKHIQSETFNSLGSLNSKDIYTYNVNGNMIDWSRTDSIGNQMIKTIYTYDDNQNNIEKYTESQSGAWWKSIYKYDQLSNKIEETSSDLWSSENSKSIYKYDGNRNLIETSIYSYEGELSFKEIYIYDHKGNKIEQRDEYSRHGRGSLDKHIYKYDDKDNLLERFRYSLNDNIQYRNAYTYEYDMQGNWITKTEIINNVTEFIAKREIEYF